MFKKKQEKKKRRKRSHFSKGLFINDIMHFKGALGGCVNSDRIDAEVR